MNLNSNSYGNQRKVQGSKVNNDNHSTQYAIPCISTLFHPICQNPVRMNL